MKLVEAREILTTHSFRITSHRCDVLEYFIRSKSALTHADLERVFKDKIDRVSLYRILQAFSDKNILCKLIDCKGAVSYFFDKHALKQNSHFHPHYKCKTCNDVVELPELPKAYLEQLKRMNIEELNILAEGNCKACEKKEKKNA
ncbi:Fur family transcriptional regulator [Algoriphagus sp.]|uniref:Fur family transcriptional regulator n=1 Tax=Algoriphagus sp. TaxID=1872435 RepID=UPI003F7259EB